jgi:hypothetical protein
VLARWARILDAVGLPPGPNASRREYPPGV